MRRWWIIGLGMLLASLALAGGAIWYIRAMQPDQAQSSVPDDKDPVPLGNGSETKGISLGSDSGQANVEGGNGGTNDSDTSDSTKPEDLAKYDQFKDKPGALFQDVRIGTGLEAGLKNTLTVNYRGWLTDGRLFDDSYQTGKTFSFQLGSGQVITGWDQGLVGMKVGGKRRLIVPPAVGYGAQGHDPIPGNAVLVFDVELLDVK
jgi:hypothetical protein